MNFFDHQTRARRRTAWLVALFIAAVATLVVLAGAVVVVLGTGFIRAEPEVLLLALAATTGGVLLVVGSGSLYKIAQLRGGGAVIAESLGGRPLDPGTTDLRQRRLLNVVEEMAIASGTPVPRVFVLDEEGINAFAAGRSTSDAVIGVTRGALEALSRDELQGVIAHEFSHILNGDMRLNLRLVGVVHGLLVLGLVGYTLMRLTGSSRSRKGTTQLALVGAALWTLGYAGTFFGNLMKAAVSRQREFLADASAVQFTRNPQGIAGALRTIGGWAKGSRLAAPQGREVSHMLFGQGFVTAWAGLLATHPPLAERIRRIDPAFDGSFPKVRGVAPVEAEERVSGFAAAPPETGRAPRETVVERVGRPGPAHVVRAREILAALPQRLVDAARDPYESRALVYAFLLGREEGLRRQQINHLAAAAEPAVFRMTQTLWPLASACPREDRLALLDLALSSLRGMSRAQYRAFSGKVSALMQADERIDLFEWVLRRLILHTLDPVFGEVRATDTRRPRSLRRMAAHAAVLLSVLARVGQSEPALIRGAFSEGAKRLRMKRLALLPAAECSLAAVDQALDGLADAVPWMRRRMIAAAAACIAADRAVTAAEGELFRAVAGALGVPVPLLLPGQALS
jgi:Zn-dependent protease with chaperone function